ncbi:MAG: hypothetical protein H7A51_08830 [Akkermansiaceae bacterium]|nr:hypothetical protein [Akkermansiaceae bacterium]
MQLFICPRDWTFSRNRFTPTHLVSLQNPKADVSDLRPPWIPEENHHVSYFYDVDLHDHHLAPTREDIESLVGWLLPRCQAGTENRLIVHCDAGLGRSTATGYIAAAINLGPGREDEAFQHMVDSALERRLMPNSVIIRHADAILDRNGALIKPLKEWNRRVNWRRTFQ